MEADPLEPEMKRLIKGVVRSLGYHVSTRAYTDEFLPGPHLAELFRRAEIQCVIDVGANLGQYRDFLREVVGFDGAIISFEPVPEHVRVLRQRAAGDRRWSVYDCALGEVEGVLDINITRSGDLSSFLQPSLTTEEGVTAMEIMSRTSVRVRRLDALADVLAETCPLRHTFLKVDTQGFDLQVLRGAGGTLRAIPALQTEMSILSIYEQMPGFSEVYQFLRQSGFDLTGLFPVSRDRFLRVREFDGTFVNRELLPAAP